MTLWDWAKLTWDRPGVGAACVSLQDEHRQCVPLLLWGLWRVENGGFDSATAEHAVALCRSMEEAVIAPLRTARRNAPLADRERLLANELKAEHELLDLLESLLPLREKVAAQPTDEGSHRPIAIEDVPLCGKCGATPHPALWATFSRKGRRIILAELSALWGHPMDAGQFDTLLDALNAHEVADV